MTGNTREDRKWFCTRNSLLRAQVIPSDITLGMGNTCNLAHASSPAFEITEYFKPFRYETLLRYPKTDILEDGLLLGEEYLAGAPSLIRAQYGKGFALLYGFLPAFRGWTEDTFKTIFNALYQTDE